MASSLSAGEAVRPGALPRRLRARRLDRWGGYLGILLVGCTLAAVWLISGVPIGDAARFAAFEALYVVLPGCLLYLLLSPHPGGRLRVLAIGWPLGYALEIGAFALTATLHVRGAFALLPLVAALTLGPCVAYRRSRSRPESPARAMGAVWGNGRSGGRGGEGERGAGSLIAALAIALALVLLAFRFFATYPLPEHASSVFYFLDNVEDISLSAEALHHWPITEPFIAGHPFRYYTGVFIHVAAIKQVMGVPLAVTILRLLPAMAILVAALQFWCLGGLLIRSRWAGPLTVALLIVVENMKLYPTHTKVFGVALFSEFTWSPTYGYGVVFLLGLLILLRTHLLGRGTVEEIPSHSTLAGAMPVGSATVGGMPAGSTPAGSGPAGTTSLGAVGSLAMLGILVLGTGAVKTTAVATFVGGLGLLWLWRLLIRRPDRMLFYCLVLSFVCFVATYFLLLSGSGNPASGYTEFAPLNFLKYTVFGSTLVAHPGLVPLVGVAVVMFAWKLLPVLGAVWPLSRRGAWSPYTSLAVAIFVVGFCAYAVVGSPNDNETYFIWYGYIALIPIATASLTYVWRDLSSNTRRAIVRASAATLVLGLALAGSTQILISTGALAGARRDLWYGGTLVLAGGLVVLWSVRIERHLTSRSYSRRVRVAACCVLLFGVLGCAQSIVLAVPQTWRTVLDRQTVPRDSRRHPGMTAALYRGLVWVRDHTDECDILAADTHELPAADGASAKPDAGYFYYSAFTERRVLLEGWIATARGQYGEQPYPALFALNSAATLRGSQAAVRALAGRGVSYILIDKSHGGDVREPSRVSRLVFSNSALDVYRLTVPIGRHGC